MQGLTVQGVSRDRLTPRSNENITVPDEVGRAIVRRNLARQFTESRIAIALVGLGLRPAALTVRGHVRATITFAGLARVAANLPPTVESSSIPKPARPSNACRCGCYAGGCGRPEGCRCDADCPCGSSKWKPAADAEVELDGVASAGYDARTPATIEVEL